MTYRTLLAFALALFIALPVAAQGVPDWAAPGDRSSRAGSSDYSRSDYSRSASPAANAPRERSTLNSRAARQNDAPPMPGEPDPIPVDGGLALLALAGAGYAARRLRKQEA